MTNAVMVKILPVPTGPLEEALDLRSAGLLTDALSLLRSASDVRSRTVRAEIEFELGRFADAALSYFSVALSELNASPTLQYNLALCLLRCERWHEATEAFERVLQRDRNQTEARLGLGSCLLHLNRAEEALRNFDLGLRGPERERALLGKAVALQLLGRFREAERAYETLLSSDPASEEALANLMVMSMAAEDLESAQEHAFRLLKTHPHSAAALQGLASMALDASDHEAAIHYCDRILELAPDCVDAWHNMRIAMDRAPAEFSGPEVAIGIDLGRDR
jgi:tetratricopeptide (TPR) repeat protein